MTQAQNCPPKILDQLLLSAKIARRVNVSKVFNFYNFVKNWWVSRGELEKYVIYASSIGEEMVTQHLSGILIMALSTRGRYSCREVAVHAKSCLARSFGKEWWRTTVEGIREQQVPCGVSGKGQGLRTTCPSQEYGEDVVIDGHRKSYTRMVCSKETNLMFRVQWASHFSATGRHEYNLFFEMKGEDGTWKEIWAIG